MPNRLPTPVASPIGKEGIYSAALVSSVAAGAAAGASADAVSFGAASGAAASAAGSASEEVQRVCVCQSSSCLSSCSNIPSCLGGAA